MMSDKSGPQLIVRQAFDAASLAESHPPRFTHPNKKLVHALCSKASEPPRGTIMYSRWSAGRLPARIPADAPSHAMREDVFGYEPAPATAIEWYLNFADPRLFFAYAGSLLAQDELQVLEHPSLGSLLEVLRVQADARYRPCTVENGEATPVLVRGVERRCAFATDPDPTEGRPLGLYGNRFARANEDAIRRAVTILTPPTVSNVLAMSAPPGGTGRYTEDEIRGVLSTAATGFGAARLDAKLAREDAAVVVHTGHWGTGAFGGNKVLMATLQMLAARLAGIDGLVFHTFDEVGTEAWVAADRLARELFPSGATPEVFDIVRTLHAKGFVWGVSDGN
jgi:hypothetical protein